MKVRTNLCHSGRGDQTQEVRPVNAPVMRASTILFQNYDTWQKYRELRKDHRVLSYGARGTATNFELEKLVTELEDGYRAQLFPTGLAALAMVLLNYAKSGTHFIVSDAIYGPVRTVVDQFLKKVDVEVSYCKADCSDLEVLIRPNTTLLLCESPGSILYEIIDLPKVSKIAHDHGLIVAIDNTYSSGLLFNPLKHGADISVIAATKYLSGHSDVTMGVVVCNEKAWKGFSVLPEALGFTVSPDDAYLVLRGMRTLPIRLKEHEVSTDAVVDFLVTRPEIKTVFYPKLKTHPGHEVFKRDYQGTNGMVTIEFADGYTKEDAIKFSDALELFACGASWGGYESLATVTTPPRTASDWSKRGPFVRFHIGLEDPIDLIEDLGQALDQISKEKGKAPERSTK
ncbi:MAG: PLP-dependent aspartate aminotransferase family protein [Burkholderiales bacterium]|nr:PLP-dependent aspartate aminotransferase family protein [Burkholderiales bacterium]